MPSIFLSHSSRDKFFVRELAKKLQDAGVKVWIDEAELKIGDSLTQNIGRAIEQTKYFGAVLSHNSINSEWVQTELRIALTRELSEKNVIVLPILMESVEIPVFLRDKVHADFTTPDKADKAFSHLLRSLGVPASRREILEDKRAEPSKPVETVPYRQHPSARRRLNEFEDITIAGMDVHKSFKPDPAKALLNIYIELSGIPAEEWQEIFEARRRFPRHTMWRRAWIEGQYIVIYCVPDELETYHFNDLREDVEHSNCEHRKYLKGLAEKEATELNNQYDELNKLKDIKERLFRSSGLQ